MVFSRLRQFSCISFFLLFLASLNVQAAKPAASVNGLETLRFNEQQVQEKISNLKKKTQDEATTLELSLFEQVLTNLANIRESKTKITDYENQIVSAPKLLKQIEAEIAIPIEEIKPVSADKASLKNLMPALETLRNQLNADRELRSKFEDQSVLQTERKKEIPVLLTNYKTRMEEIRQLRLAQKDVPKSGPEKTANLWLLESEYALLNSRLKELDLEVQNYEARRALLRAQKQQVERRILGAEKKVAMFEEVVGELQAREAESSKQKAQETLKQMGEAHPVIVNILNRNAELAIMLSKISDQTRTYNNQKQELGKILSNLQKEFENSREIIAKIGLTDAIGLKLRNQKAKLPNIHELSVVHDQIRDAMNTLQLNRNELENELFDLIDIDREVTKRFHNQEIPAGQDLQSLSKETKKLLLEQKEKYINPLIQAYDDYFENTLIPLEATLRDTILITKNIDDFISERVLWIQSTHIISMTDLIKSIDSLSWYLGPEKWLQIYENLSEVSGLYWLYAISMMMAAFLLLGYRKRLLEVMERNSQSARKKYKAKLDNTLYVMLCCTILSMPFSLLFVSIGLVFAQISNSHLAIALAAGLHTVAILLFFIRFFIHILSRHGLADAHFNWSAHVISVLRKQIRLMEPVILVLVFIVSLTSIQISINYHDSLGRIAFIIACLYSAYVVHRIIRPSNGILMEKLKLQQEGWLSKLKKIWHPLILLIPLSLAFIAIIGYFYTGQQLAQKAIASLLLIVFAYLIREVLVRWISLTQHHMAMDQARKKFQAMLKARDEKVFQETGVLPSGGGQSMNADKAEMEKQLEAIDVENVSIQTQKLISSLLWFSIIFGFYWIWKDILPAFGMLREVELWSDVVNTVAGSVDGATTQQLIPITLADLGLALIIIIVTIMVSQNIPGLLEIAILQHLPFTPSGRYAITTVARYILVILGIVMAFKTLGIGWSKVQWLAAAITVGLGFGLQEIFANFVSGLIILFERPIRVGDSVTIGNVSGKVTRIQIRATTITDWNRKELIIPNKEFVTGSVINWTLTDTIIRIPISIGLAYGSDTEKARKILMEIVNNSPSVLKDPEPTAFFTGFADSSLNFELRLFIANTDDFFAVRHEILTKIDQAFKDANIEIAFPQRDIHIRSVEKLTENLLGSISPKSV